MVQPPDAENGLSGGVGGVSGAIRSPPPDPGDPSEALSSVPKIHDAEIAWHLDKLQQNEGRKTVMLSHYQLFTASGNIGRTEENRPLAVNPVLYDAFHDSIAQIDLWLWGHEHNFIVFDPYLGLKRGRCIGSGALPVPLIWQPYKTLPNLSLPEDVAEPPRINPHAQLGHDETPDAIHSRPAPAFQAFTWKPQMLHVQPAKSVAHVEAITLSSPKTIQQQGENVKRRMLYRTRGVVTLGNIDAQINLFERQID